MDFKKISEAAREYDKAREMSQDKEGKIEEMKKIKVRKKYEKDESLPKKMDIRGAEEEAPNLSNILKKVRKYLQKKERKKSKDGSKVRGIELPEGVSKAYEIKKKEDIDITKINISYSLTPVEPKRGEEIYAYASIRWNPSKSILVYKVIEPKMSRNDKLILKKVKSAIQERLDVDFTKLSVKSAMDYLEEKFNEILEFVGYYPSEKEKKIIKYYIYRDFIGLGKIEPLMHDPYIEDISCDGVGIPVFAYHRNPFIGSIETNVMFENDEELNTFVMKLAQKSEKSISMAKPLVDASLPDGSRIQMTFGTDIAMKGSNFTIRKFTKDPITPIDLMKSGSVDSKVLAYLWFCIEHGKSMLLSGGTATGKTTLLNVLSMFIKPSMKVVSIEDTPELRFSHPHWVPEVARQALSEMGGSKFGKVDLYDLLRESLRQRPDYIIVGEVRGKEAYVLFQQMATGHPGLSTIHAETMDKLINRLRTEPINLPPSLLENLDIIIFLTRTKKGDSYIRRIKMIKEMDEYDQEKDVVKTNTAFEWDPTIDVFESGGSIMLENIAKQTGIPEDKVREEIKNRMQVLEWAKEQGIKDYRDFGKIVRMYYANSEKFMKKVKGFE